MLPYVIYPDCFPAPLERVMRASLPHEAAAIITHEDEVIEIPNISDSPENSFELPSDTLPKYGPRIKYLVHSHPNSWPIPSIQDMEGQLVTNMPWGIISLYNDELSPLLIYGDASQVEKPSSIDPSQYVNRPFIHGMFDCYSLIRDYYRESFALIIPEIPRGWEWWASPEDSEYEASRISSSLYLDNFRKAGFYLLDKDEPLKRGDIVAMCIRSSKGPNHAAVVIDNEGTILHHLSGKNPIDRSRIPYTSNLYEYRSFITHHARHKDLPHD